MVSIFSSVKAKKKQKTKKVKLSVFLCNDRAAKVAASKRGLALPEKPRPLCVLEGVAYEAGDAESPRNTCVLF